MTRTGCAKIAFGVLLPLAAAACTGGIGDAAPEPAAEGAAAPPSGPAAASGDTKPAAASGAAADGTPAAVCRPGAAKMGATTLRRLTREEYRNTVADLFGVVPPLETELPDDASFSGFTTTAGQKLSASTAIKYFEAAAGIGSALVTRVPKLLPCAAQGLNEAACVQEFLQTTGRRIFRRPTTPDERAHYAGVFAKARQAVAFEESVSVMVQSMLTAPQFLFLIEPGGGTPGAPRALDSWQLAARLSYLLWRTTPDAALLEAAARDELKDRAKLAAHVQRLLGDARAKPAIAGFFEDWLKLEEIDKVQKDMKKFPLATSTAIKALALETRKFVEELFWAQGGDVSKLFVSPVRFRSKELAKFYGDIASTSAEPALIRADVTERSFGLLSQAGFLMAIGHNDDEAIIYRGKFVRNQILCGRLPPPPPGLAGTLPSFKPGMTSRQRIEAHTKADACMGCHGLINPPGFALEHFDGAGLWRDTENGLAIDARTTISGTDIGAVDGALDLSSKLAASRSAHDCAAAQLFAYAFNREPSSDDACALAALQEKLQTAKLSLRALLAEAALSDAFFARVEPQE